MAPEVWTAIAAIATTVSAAVIAWQAILTRRSLGYTRKSLKLTEDALEEARRARIDLGAPTNLIVAWPTGDGPFAELGPRFNQPENDRRGVLGWSDTFDVPADEDRPLWVYTRVDIHNVGNVSAYLTTTYPVTPLWDFEVRRDTQLPKGSTELFVTAGEHWRGWVVVALKAGEWVARANSSDVAALSFDVECWGRRSADVRIIARCELTGSPVRSSPGNMGTFSVPTHEVSLLSGHSLGVDRTYTRRSEG